VIPSVIIQDEQIAIPVLNSDNFCFFIWKEEESVDIFLKRASQSEYVRLWASIGVWTEDEDKKDEYSEGTFYIYVYDVLCCKTEKEFHLICYGEITDFDDIKNCVCLPFNRLNLLTFYKKYLSPFSKCDFYLG
jgi:hypothetical protein